MPRDSKPGRLSLFPDNDSTLIVGRDGWAYWFNSQLDNADVWLRFKRSEGGRFEIVDAHISGKVSGPLLRSLPLSRIEASVNAPGLDRSLEWRFNKGEPVGPGLWPDTKAKKNLLKWREGPAQEDATVRPATVALSVNIPPVKIKAGKKPDDFYKQVAERYSALASQTRRPAAVLAEKNGVPASTIHRWVREARRRGLLSPGHPGRAG
jgi:hypothetical protein